MLTVWGRKTSPNVQALMWCIGELGLDYRRHDVGHFSRRPHAAPSRYYEALAAHAAFRAHVMVSYDELRPSNEGG